jgi:putative DNA primase/helicase
MSIIVEPASSVQLKSVRWLWDGFIALGKLHILAGESGTAKSAIMLSVAAAVTTGGMLPDGSKAERGTVLFYTTEDDYSDTVAPRLRAAGADVDKVLIIKATNRGDEGIRRFDPSADIQEIGQTLESLSPENRPKLLIFDPLVSLTRGMSYVSVRDALTPVVEMVNRYGVAVVGIHHVAKGSAKKPAHERVLGSQAFVVLARIVMMTGRCAAGGYAMAVVKTNFRSPGGGYGYILRCLEWIY